MKMKWKQIKGVEEMGLDTTHDCWHGGYSGFNVWRGEIAKVINVPLELMEGYCNIDETQKLLTQGMPLFMVEVLERRLLQWLPISWDALKPDPLLVLLDHSDCDGQIEVKDCLPLAERLEAIAPLLPNANSHFHFNMQEKAQAFARGLRLAAERNENVKFG